VATAGDLLLSGAQVVTVDDGRPGAKRGRAASNDLGVIEDGAVLVRGGKVAAVGPSAELERRFPKARRRSLRGKTLLPGLVAVGTAAFLCVLVGLTTSRGVTRRPPAAVLRRERLAVAEVPS